MNRVKGVIKWTAIAIPAVLVLLFAGTLVQLEIGNRAVRGELAQAGPFKIGREIVMQEAQP